MKKKIITYNVNGVRAALNKGSLVAASSTFGFGFREFADLIVFKLFFEVFAVGEEVEELERSLLRFPNVLTDGLVEELLAEVVLPGAAAFDLNEVSRREDRAEEAEV